MYKIIILDETSEDNAFFLTRKKRGYDSYLIFKKTNKFARGIRRFWVKSGIPFQQIWYNNSWKEIIKSAQGVIVHISPLNMRICKYINSLNPQAKVIAWYWNKVENATVPSRLRGCCTAWSFDPEDCRKYGMCFNHQYYFKGFVLPPTKINQDIYFCGSDSGRGKVIVNIYQEMHSLGLSTLFQVVYPKYSGLPNEIKSQYVSYAEIRRHISESKAVLEIVREGQSGGTLRLMEAVFFQKKLITNNPYVIEEDFYDENRIFLLGKRNMSELPEFMGKNFVPYSSGIIEKYEFEQWVCNFFEE